MKRTLLKKNYKVREQVYIDEIVISANPDKDLILGWATLDTVDCDPPCGGAVKGGVELCVGGHCIFFPNP